MSGELERIEVFVVAQNDLKARRFVFDKIKGLPCERVFLGRKDAELYALRANARNLEGMTLQHWVDQKEFVYSVTFDAEGTW